MLNIHKDVSKFALGLLDEFILLLLVVFLGDVGYLILAGQSTNIHNLGVSLMVCAGFSFLVWLERRFNT